MGGVESAGGLFKQGDSGPLASLGVGESVRLIRPTPILMKPSVQNFSVVRVPNDADLDKLLSTHAETGFFGKIGFLCGYIKFI